MQLKRQGKVFLIGAGPGDPGLITVKAVEAIGQSDVVVYDRLANPSLLNLAKENTELIDVGKSRGKHSWPQQKINELLVKKASLGKIVARLKGGDPFVLGRGGEEALALYKNNLIFEIIPGVTSAVAAPAYAGIPVTHRTASSSFAVVTGHEDSTKEISSINWSKLATGIDTLIFLMGMENLAYIVAQLMKHGRSARTPVALISRGTLPLQQTVTGSLDNIVEKAEKEGIKSPAVIVVGEVVALRNTLRWFDNRPLFGKTVLITRPKHQAAKLTALLEREGAQVLEASTIEIEPNLREVNKVINELAGFDWLVFTSANGVNAFFQGLINKGLDARCLYHARICAVGPATAQSLSSWGIKADLVPPEYSTEGILNTFRGKRIKGKALLLLRADLATGEMEMELEKRGAKVRRLSVYKTNFASNIDVEIAQKLARGDVDIITFTSASTVKGFMNVAGEYIKNIKIPIIACIGPVTSAAAKDFNLKVDLVAREYTIEGLVSALKKYLEKSQK